MDGFDAVRRLARLRHAEACAKAGGQTNAAALLDAATQMTEIFRQAVPAGDPVLCGAEAVLEPDTPAIFFRNDVPADQAAFYQAHEFGHHWLDSSTGACSTVDISDTMPEERIPLGIQRVEGYSSRERRECQANVFAREFLLPCDLARSLFITERLGAPEIAARLGVPLGLVYQQLAQALLVPDLPPPEEPETPSAVLPLDDSQRAAAEAENGPHLIEAGPGTGKTRTLIARIEWLLRRGADPDAILALTFSNKAAEEMRERVALAAPAAAPAIWAGTFHAFGLEVLRKYGNLIGLPPDVRLVDPGDALLLLEERLPSLPLNHYLQLYEPALALRDILTAISRAKDEMINSAQYRALGESMLAGAASPDERETAEKAIEVADVFAAYEQMLAEKSVVDFADLILKPIALLGEHPLVAAELRARYREILVDEYQDVNRASGVLLKRLAGDGNTLWVVGDARQSIYRFRGASPANIRGFEQDFPGAKRLSLDINYRSLAPVVRLVEAYAPHMRASTGGLPARWTAHRGEQGGEILMEVASDLAAEAAGIAGEIRRRRSEGIAYRDQAVLCRSHTNLARFAARLEALDIPVLYLGDLFERPEIRDMLALLSLTCEPERGGLVRVARLPEYAVPLEDIGSVLAFARDHKTFPVEALAQLDEVPDLSANGRDGLALLASHLDSVEQRTSPATMLFEYLFAKSRYLDPVLANETTAGQQQRLALFQLLQFALEHTSPGRDNPRRALLQWVRRLETFGDERQLRQLPAAAAGIDAVRLLTVHASKGLEFGAVYLPALATTMFPLSWRGTPCPPPAGMLIENPVDSHREEEECLFFVAMSRARDYLCLSRAETYGPNRKASPFLLTLGANLPRSPEAAPRWRDGEALEGSEVDLTAFARNLDVHAAEDLDHYLRCPLSYFYQRVLGLSGARNDNAYVQFHRAVYSVLRWLTRDAGIEVTLREAFARLDEAWVSIGPADHPYAPLYHTTAQSIVRRAVDRRTGAAELVEAVWHIDLPEGRVRVEPDHVEKGPNGLVVRRLRTGRPPKKPPDDGLYALYHRGASKELGAVMVEALYLTTDQPVEVPMSARVIQSRLDKYGEAMAGIRAGNFRPNPSERDCPRCPQYFICHAASGQGAKK